MIEWILSHTLVPQPRRRVSAQAKGPLDLSAWQGGITAGFFSVPRGSRICWCFCILWWCELNCKICLVIRQTVTYLRSSGRKSETTIKIPCLSSRYLGNWSFGVSFYPLLTRACPVNTSRKDCNSLLIFKILGNWAVKLSVQTILTFSSQMGLHLQAINFKFHYDILTIIISSGYIFLLTCCGIYTTATGPVARLFSIIFQSLVRLMRDTVSSKYYMTLKKVL